jgi:hypothetical protein
VTDTLVLTDDERALILALREIEARPGAPIPGSIRERKNVWFSLIEARAMLYRDAVRHAMNDVFERQQKMYAVVTPFDLIDLVQGWRALQARMRLDDEAELHEADE